MNTVNPITATVNATKNTISKILAHLFWVTFAFTGVVFWTSVTEAKTTDESTVAAPTDPAATTTSKRVIKKKTTNRVDIILMKTPKGEIEKMVYDYKAPRATRPEIPTVATSQSFGGKDHLCKIDQTSQNDMLDLVETRLELKTIIQSLNIMEKPRDLSVQQKVFIAQIPFCNPFVTDLMIVSKLLKGYDLVKIARRK